MANCIPFKTAKKSKAVPKTKRRTLLNNSRVNQEESPLRWSFNSKCPGKWIHVDCETGKIYAVKRTLDNVGYSFPRPSDKLIEAATMALVLERSQRNSK